MVARSNRTPPLPQVLPQRVSDPVTQRAFDNVTQALEAAVDNLQPFVQKDPWHKVGLQGQVAFNTGWQDFTPTLDTYALAAFRKTPLGRVDLRGIVEQASGSETRIFTLPVGYRPAKNEIFVVYTDSGAGLVEVQSGGPVILQAGGTSYVSLSGISFDTE